MFPKFTTIKTLLLIFWGTQGTICSFQKQQSATNLQISSVTIMLDDSSHTPFSSYSLGIMLVVHFWYCVFSAN